MGTAPIVDFGRHQHQELKLTGIWHSNT